jgi:hypothetical protein
MLSMIGVGLSLTTPFAMEETPSSHLKAARHQRISPTQSQNDYISALPDELKMNILERLDPKSLAAISETSTDWYNQTHDKNFVKKEEAHYQKLASQAGITSKCNPHDTWTKIFMLRHSIEWVFNNFKKGVNYFTALAQAKDCLIGSGCLNTDLIQDVLRTTPSGKAVVDILKNRLVDMTRADLSSFIIHFSKGLKFNHDIAMEVMRRLVEKKDPRALRFLTYKHVTNEKELLSDELLTFYALNEIPVLSTTSIFFDPDKLALLDKNDLKVITAIRSSLFLDSIRQFIKDYSRLTLERQQQHTGMKPHTPQDLNMAYIWFYHQNSQARQVQSIGSSQQTPQLRQTASQHSLPARQQPPVMGLQLLPDHRPTPVMFYQQQSQTSQAPSFGGSRHIVPAVSQQHPGIGLRMQQDHRLTHRFFYQQQPEHKNRK